MPLDLLLDLPREERNLCLAANEFVSHIQKQTADAYALAREHLRVDAEWRTTSYDIKAWNVEFYVRSGFGTGIPAGTCRGHQNGRRTIMVIDTSLCTRWNQ